MKRERRVMKRGEIYEIEEKISDGDWAVVCQCATINEAKQLLKNLKVLDGEEKND
ncbi:hypothetical protein IJH24_03520 [Candidatus Saccharibacteria bacterium]|nr:hypothetical protein [Candidatus Saccharibacteria bacterium]